MQAGFPAKPRGDMAFHGDETDLLPVIDIVDIYVLMCGGDQPREDICCL